MYKIVHRGASAHELENTFKAFEKAIELGADGICTNKPELLK